MNWEDWPDNLEAVTVCKCIFITSCDPCGQVEDGVVQGYMEQLWCWEEFGVLLKDATGLTYLFENVALTIR